MKIFSTSLDWPFSFLKIEQLPDCTTLPHPRREKSVKVPEVLSGMFLLQYAHCLHLRITYNGYTGATVHLRPRIEILAIHSYVKEERNVQYAGLEDVIARCPPHELSITELATLLSDDDKAAIREYSEKTWAWEDWRGQDIRTASGQVHVELKEVAERKDVHEKEEFVMWFD